MKIIDITRTLQEAPLYHKDQPAQFTLSESIDEGAECNASVITAGVHLGTHADAFSHFLPEGASIDKMPLENYCGKCRVLTVPSDTLVKLSDIKGRLAGCERLALRSGGSSFLCEQAAEYIAACGIKAVLTDAVSVAPADNEECIHRLLMEGKVAIIENVTLEGVEDGDYLLFAFPVKYGGADGAPVRAVLIAE